MPSSPIILWLRNDLRLLDNPALFHAVQTNRPIIPVYIEQPGGPNNWSRGSASNVWFAQSLRSFANTLQGHGSKLIIRSGSATEVLRAVTQESQSDTVFFNRYYEPYERHTESKVESLLQSVGGKLQSFRGNVLLEPWEIQTRNGQPYKVFTPFYKAIQTTIQAVQPYPAPTQIISPDQWPNSLTVEDLGLETGLEWESSMMQHWISGEDHALKTMESFLREKLENYPDGRDIPSRPFTSTLSPYLSHGELSPRKVLHSLQSMLVETSDPATIAAAETFVRQLIWREFAVHLLYHFPHTTEQPLNEKFSRFPWNSKPDDLRTWQRCETGYPIVDAGMRQLWQTGWMHNRVRMIVASFLVKHLLQPWQDGARWFRDTLVDADLANNTLGWQWVAGSGADAAPYFRIFNPVLQGEKFDKDGEYVKKWVPELSKLPSKWIHKPWQAPKEQLQYAGITLGTTYPEPMVDHTFARERALAAYNSIK